MTAGAYDASYFTRLYGRMTANGQPAQTLLDRLRDARIGYRLQRHAPQEQPRALLDIGCGFGWMLQRAGESFDRYGVDISSHAVLRAQRLIPGATITVGNIEEGIPFERAFEAIVAVNLLEHLNDPGATVKTIFDHLVPGGIAIIHLPTIDNVINRVIYKATYEQDETHVYRPASREVRELFQERGFSLVAHSHSPHIPALLWHAAPWHPAYLAVFRRSA